MIHISRVTAIGVAAVLAFLHETVLAERLPLVLDIPFPSANRAISAVQDRGIGVRNPFSWPREQGGTRAVKHAKKPLNLEAILWNSQHPLALINHRLVQEGDLIGGGMVIAIEKDMVLIRGFQGEEQKLRIKKDIIEVFLP